MKFYKQCCLVDGKLYSSNMGNSISIEYHADKINYAPAGTGLFVFNSLKRAMDWDSHIPGKVLFECEVVNPVEMKTIPDLCYAKLYWEYLTKYGKPSVYDYSLKFGSHKLTALHSHLEYVYTVSQLKFLHEIDRKTGLIIRSF